jgi:hypothetical protein
MKSKLLLALVILIYFGCKKSTEAPPVEEERPEGADIPKCQFVKQTISTMGPAVVSLFFNAINPDDQSSIDYLTVHNLDVIENEKDQTGKTIELHWKGNAYHLKAASELNYSSRVVLVLDVSAETDVAKVKEAAHAFIEGLAAGQQLSIITFAGNVETIHAFSDDKGSLNAAVDLITNGGANAVLYDAVKAGLDSWDDVYTYDEVLQGNLLVVTDGPNTGGTTTMTDLIFARDPFEMPSKRIYTFAVGNAVDADALQELTNAGYYALADISGLPAEIVKAGTDINDYLSGFYMFDYMSYREGLNEVEVTLKLLDNQYSGTGSELKGEYSTRDFYQPLKGITINANKSQPNGVETLKIGRIAPRKVTVFNSYGYEISAFEWRTSSSAILNVEEDPEDNRCCLLTALGEIGDQATLTVEDVPNGTSRDFTVEIVDAGTGQILVEFIENLPGRGLVLLKDSRKFPDNPDKRGYAKEFNLLDWDPTDYDDFGARMRGYVIPPETGQFQFSISLDVSDEMGELYLGSGPYHDDVQLIAFRNVDGSDVSSDYLEMEAGKVYYIDMLYKEDRGGHSCQVRWRRDRDAGEESVIGTRSVVIEGEYLAPWVSDYMDYE